MGIYFYENLNRTTQRQNFFFFNLHSKSVCKMSPASHARHHLSVNLPEGSHLLEDVRAVPTSVWMCLSNKFLSDNHSPSLAR